MTLVQDNNALVATLEAAERQLEKGNTTAAANQLQAFLNQVDALVRSGRMSASQADALHEEVARVLKSIA